MSRARTTSARSIAFLADVRLAWTRRGGRLAARLHHPLEPRQRARHDVFARAEREADGVAEARRAMGAPPARVAVEALAGRGALHRRVAAELVDVVRVELVEDEGAAELLAGADPGREILSAHVLAGRVARVAHQDRGEPAPLDLATQVADGERVALLALEQ